MKLLPKNTLRTWIEIDKNAVFHNIKEFRKLIKPDVKLMAVVKSNAYGHSLVDFAKIVENNADGFGVDSIVEGLKLRQSGLKKPILVLGYTLSSLIKDAAKNNISLTVSTLGALKHLAALKNRPKIHLKIDTGMHRQGFFLKDIPGVIATLKKFKIEPEGLYTHLAIAKDRLQNPFSLKQIETFKKADNLFKHSFPKKNYVRHVAATAGAILYPEGHFDMIRVGNGLYGMFPTKELEIEKNVNLKPVLTWKSVIGEIKKVPSGAYIGYDLTEKTLKPSTLAVIPIGFWHGFDRGLSNCGEVLVKSKKCKVLGRVSMDMIVVDISSVSNVNINDEVVILGQSGKEKITPEDMALKINTINYEITTRINPLIKRIYIN